MLYADDYRSYERSFSLLTQVVGRSGRGTSKGMAVIQSYTPDNLIISMAANQDYIAFYNAEIEVRRAMLYPPFADICLIGFVGEKQQLALKALVVKVSNKFRYKLIVKCKNNREFRSMLSALLIDFGSSKEFSDITVYADMNALIC